MTKWEKIFKSRHPSATVEGRTGHDRKRYYLVRTTRSAYMPAGDGNTKARAWKDACEALRLDKAKP
jgi:hypothetical protein